MLATSAALTVLNDTSLMLKMYAWVFHQFIFLCGRYCFLDATNKAFGKSFLS